MDKKFAQIYDNKVYSIFTSKKTPVFAPNIVLVEITNLDPQPEQGWIFDVGTQTFLPPIPPEFPSLDRIFLRVLLSKEGAMPPFCILNDGVDSVKIDLMLSTETIDKPGFNPYSGPIRLKMEAGIHVGDIFQTTMIDNHASFNYHTTMAPTIYNILGVDPITSEGQDYPIVNLDTPQLTVCRIL